MIFKVYNKKYLDFVQGKPKQNFYKVLTIFINPFRLQTAENIDNFLIC